MRVVEVIGGGPAGCAAAITAALAGAQVQLHEKSRLPRHKVCGEFLSPEILPLFDSLGVAERFHAAKPARIRRLRIAFQAGEKSSQLPETAYGLSRFVLDKMLFDRAGESGAVPAGASEFTPGRATVFAHGRRAAVVHGSRGSRLFGFKAHFHGPTDDAIELHFFDSGYAGVSCVENGVTNVCGLATENVLARVGFEYDQLLKNIPSLNARIGPLQRTMDWLSTGPLVYANRFGEAPAPDIYYAGDALSFVDPFTGSGMYCAALTGTIAGRSAAGRIDPAQHIRLCRAALGRPFVFARFLRRAITSGWAQHLARYVPLGILYYVTRPSAARAAH